MSRELTRNTLLRRAETITLSLLSAGNCLASVEGRTISIGVHGLAVLAACPEPTPLGMLVDRVTAKSGRDFADLVAIVLELVDSGVLLTDRAPTRVTQAGHWSAPEVHIGMLDDELRTRTFLEAVRALTRPDDVVIDIGTGTGVLAVGAALAGARHVIAIESSAMIDRARALAEKNGVADRMTFLQGWSSRVDVPERGTLLVTETIGNDPLGEHIIEIVTDAKKRLLAPGARIIPNAIAVYACLAELSDDLYDSQAFTARNTARWSRAYGMDFSALAAPPARNFAATLRQSDAEEVRELSPPVRVATIDFTTTQVPPSVVTLRAEQGGRFDAILTFFSAELSPGNALSSRPYTSTDDNSWSTRVWIEPSSRQLAPGEEVTVSCTSGPSRVLFEVVP